MAHQKLTKATIDAAPSPAKDMILWDGELKGFGLKITPAGRKVFLVQYRPAGDNRNPRKYTIGEYGPFTPHQARIEAQRVLAERAAGRDPQADKRAARRRIASEQISDLVAEFLARHASQNRTGAETARILRREALPFWGSKTVSEVSKRDVIVLLDSVRERGSPIMANRVLAAIRKFFNWCIGRGILESSPCAGVNAPGKETARHRTLNDDELRAILKAVREVGHPFGAIVRMLALTGQRREEVARATWAHIDLDRTIWTIPGEHAKNGKPHVVHLSAEALKLINATPRLGEIVFSGNGNSFKGYSKAKARLDKLAGIVGWTLHDLRRTVVSGMARLGVPPHVADKVLNHQSGVISGVAAVYQRHEFMDERRDALDRWGAFIASLD